MRDLIKNGKLYLYGPVGCDYCWDDDGFTEQEVLTALNSLSGDIYVHLNSPGGLVYDGIPIHTALLMYEGKVTIQVDGLAASVASLICCAADEVIMAPGAQIMIHDPSDFTFGTADDHRKKAAHLDSITESGAEIYSKKSGQTVEACLAMMADETWLNAEAAVEQGFADSVLEYTPKENAAPEMMAAGFPKFDYSVFQKAPEAVMSASVPLDLKSREVLGKPKQPDKPAAIAAQPEEPSMSKPKTNEPNEPAPTIVTSPRMSVDEFIDLAERNNLTSAQMKAVKKKSIPADLQENETNAIDPVMARDAVLDIVTKNQPEPVNNHPAMVTQDAREKFIQGASLAVAKRGGLEGEQNEFSGMTMMELAKHSLTMNGATIPQNREQVARLALTGSARMAHSTSDFPAILENVSRKSMLKGHEETAEVFEQFTHEGTLPDFKENSRVDLSTLPALAAVAEDAEYKNVTIGDRKETIQLAKYGNIISVTWEMIINDDLNAFAKLPRRFGRAAKRTVGNLVFAVLTGNPAMADGVNLFHADHKNLQTGGASALSETSLSKMRQNMALQKDGESVLNIRPNFLLVPVALEDTARVLIASEFSPGEQQRVPNKARGLVRPENVIADARLDQASQTAFYGLADASQYDTIEVAYLDGESAPQLFEEESFRKDAIQFKIRQVAAVAPMSFRTMAKSAGA